MSAPQGSTSFRRILVPVDDSAEARAAVGAAAGLAATRGGEITLLSVLSLAVAAPAGPSEGVDVATLQLRAEEEALMQRFAEERLAAARREIPEDVPVRIEVDWGSAASRILDEAREHDLVVLGARHHRRLARLVHGHIAEHVLHHAEVPVLVVPVLDHRSSA